MVTAAPAIPGLRYVADFLDVVDEERALLTFVDAQPWLDDLKTDDGVARGRRVSLTYRKVRLAKPA